jgi:hypothetical protein
MTAAGNTARGGAPRCSTFFSRQSRFSMVTETPPLVTGWKRYIRLKISGISDGVKAKKTAAAFYRSGRFVHRLN